MVERRYSHWMLERIVIGDTFRLRFGSNTLGRHSSSNIRALEATYISRHHAIFEVLENDGSVTIKDVSSNGIYVNERKYDKAAVRLNNNDLIGIGVSPTDIPDDVDIIRLPIYQLKYIPMGKFEIPKVTNFSPATSSKPDFQVNGIENNKNDIKKETDNSNDEDAQKPCCSKTAKVENVANVAEIFEISDDDEFDMMEKTKSNRIDVTTQQKEINTEISSNENRQTLLMNLNKHIDNIIKNEPFSDKECINPSQKSQENTLNDVIANEDKINSAKKCLNENANLKVINNENHHKPTTSINSVESNEGNKPFMHVPIISSIKKERIRSVSADIQNIFGDIKDDDEIKKTIKELNPLVYNEIHISANLKPLETLNEEKGLNNGDCISLSDDENSQGVVAEKLGTIITQSNVEKRTIMEVPHRELKTIETVSILPDTIETNSKDAATIERPKSPNLFDSLDNSKEEEISLRGNASSEVQTSMDNIDNIDLDEYTKYVPDCDDEDIEDLMFSQVIINDMKAELQNEISAEPNLPIPYNIIDQKEQPSAANVGNTVIVKQEPGLELFSSIPTELENSCWIISDDEDYDKELETKVNDWSNKIFSQSFSLLSQNMSQVYEIAEPDGNEEDDGFEEDNFSLLEDDIDGIAAIYNSFDEPDIVKKAKPLIGEVKNEMQIGLGELSNEGPKDENIPKISITKDNDMPDEKLESVENDNAQIENIHKMNESPVTVMSDDNMNFNSPIIRMRRLSKTKPVIESSSSSEDELDVKIKKLSTDAKPEVDKPKTRPPPLVIDAPALPKHKGKLRGVSAELPGKTSLKSKTASINKTLNSTKAKIHHERYTKDLKRKWLEKPSIAKKRDKEHKKFIKECRKDKLKELAERKNSPSKQSIKRKLHTESHEHKAKVAKVKVTTHNRGAFLASNDETPSLLPAVAHGHKAEQINQFKIPKITKKSEETIKPNGLEKNKKDPLTRSVSVDCFETFSQQISKPDVLLLKRQSTTIESKSCDKPIEINKTSNPAPLRRHSVTEAVKHPTSATCKEAIAARAVRTTNKITFASMEKNIVESEQCKRKLSELSAKNPTTLKPINKNTSCTKPKKTVRFNDTPVIHYIERVTGACKKINNKDVMPLSTYKDRRHSIRTAYPIVDHTNKIISNILCWSNEWLINRNAAADAAADIIYPMPTDFNSIDHYKSIVFPLLKLEFVSRLEREYNVSQNVKKFKVSLEYTTLNEDRIMLVTKFFNNQSKEVMDSSLYDLVILEGDKRGPQIFAFVVANRKGAGSFVNTIVYEIIAKNFTVEYFKAIKEFNVRPVIDKVRVHFGAFNSVYQLQSTPLFQRIINPLELLKCRPPPKKKVIYRGFDKLNEKQRQVLLNTYIKIIDESTPNITLIQGPPGTGKSCVITNLVLQTLYGEEVRYLDKKILICAQSNAAVDVIAAKLYDISMRMRTETRFRLIRYGMLSKMQANVLPIALQKVVEHDQLKKLQAKNKNMHLENKENLKSQIVQFEAQVAEMSSRNIKGTVEEDVLIEKKKHLQLMRNILNANMRPEDERSLFSWYLSNANIVCATLSSCANLSQYIDFFDICIIDEATQCTEPFTLLPLKFGINSLVLVGDTQQLPATVLSKKANELGLGISMFTRIQNCLDNIPRTSAKGSKSLVTTPNNIIYSLQTQYRMHPEICRWPNQYFYRNELINAKSTIDFNKSPLVPFCILSLSYTQSNTGINGKITNNLEAEFVAKLLKALDGFIPNKYNSYGVITPYAHHRTTLESSIRNLGLTNIMVNTIDSYQGLEKDVIVISNARTNGIGFLSNPQRLNVALTRSKKCLILCGNFKTLESVPSWRCLLESARERKLYHEIGANCIEDIQTNVIDKIKLKNQSTSTTNSNERI